MSDVPKCDLPHQPCAVQQCLALLELFERSRQTEGNDVGNRTHRSGNVHASAGAATKPQACRVVRAARATVTATAIGRMSASQAAAMALAGCALATLLTIAAAMVSAPSTTGRTPALERTSAGRCYEGEKDEEGGRRERYAAARGRLACVDSSRRPRVQQRNEEQQDHSHLVSAAAAGANELPGQSPAHPTSANSSNSPGRTDADATAAVAQRTSTTHGSMDSVTRRRSRAGIPLRGKGYGVGFGGGASRCAGGAQRPDLSRVGGNCTASQTSTQDPSSRSPEGETRRRREHDDRRQFGRLAAGELELGGAELQLSGLDATADHDDRRARIRNRQNYPARRRRTHCPGGDVCASVRRITYELLRRAGQFAAGPCGLANHVDKRSWPRRGEPRGPCRDVSAEQLRVTDIDGLGQHELPFLSERHCHCDVALELQRIDEILGRAGVRSARPRRSRRSSPSAPSRRAR